MEKILEILKKIENFEDCIISKYDLSKVINIEYNLPDDLKYYLENYNDIILFKSSDYSIKINGITNFIKANPIIIGEEIPDDRSFDWFIIAQDDNSQYITIDLSIERLGFCYDSFWDRHGLVGEQPIIAKSFTELLEKLFNSYGKSLYWLEDKFQSYGDAYDEI